MIMTWKGVSAVLEVFHFFFFGHRVCSICENLSSGMLTIWVLFCMFVIF